MAITERKHLDELIALNGFMLKRQDGAHLVYADENNNTFVMSKTPSDWRAFMKIETSLRHVCNRIGKEYKELITDVKRHKAILRKAAFNNQPRIVGMTNQGDSSVNNEQENAQTHERKTDPEYDKYATRRNPFKLKEGTPLFPVKLLDDHALAIIQGLKKKGLKSREVLAELERQQYTTGSGRLVETNVYTAFLRKHGISWKTMSWSKKDAEVKKPAPVSAPTYVPYVPEIKPIAVQKPKTSMFLSGLEDLLASNLTDSMKEEMIKLYVSKF